MDSLRRYDEYMEIGDALDRERFLLLINHIFLKLLLFRIISKS